jgi:glycosyltransferase involved in cell wall biosynthesis
MYKQINVSFIATYIPRQCGIATFTHDLANSVVDLMGEKLSDGKPVNIIALTDTPEGYKYGSEVKFEIKDQKINDYKEAAYFLNHSPSEIISLQHEFGIFGGEYGENIVFLLQNLNKPVVTTLHTVVETPLPEQLSIMREIGNFSSYVVVQTSRASKILETIYRMPKEKIIHISHGGPDVPFIDPAYYKDKFNLIDRKVIMTFGLLSPGKGLEDVILSLPHVVKKFPDVAYIILGATHPNVIRAHGEEYRHTLENYVINNSLEDNVIFINRFVSYKELLEFILMSDIYVSPYQHKNQIVSGTLTYALSCGKAIISTPYWYAEDILTEQTGVLVPFKNQVAMADALIDLLGSESKRNRLRKNAYDKGRGMVWSVIASKYIDLFQNAREKYKKPMRLPVEKDKSSLFPSLPEVDLDQLITLTDTCGIFQHAKYSIPDRSHGYCSDDAARALLVTVMNRNMFYSENVLGLMNVYLSYLMDAFNKETKLFRNFMGYHRSWLEESGSEDSNSRVLFTLGYIIKNPPYESYLSLSKTLFEECIGSTLNFKSPRANARIIIGCLLYLSNFSGARDIRKVCKIFTERLVSLYNRTAGPKWKWFEDIVSYSNGRLPQAMMMAGKFFKNKEYIDIGLESLKWLYHVQLDKTTNSISLIGNMGWLVKGKQKAKYDQQPVEIPSLIDACYQAYKITKDEEWIERIGILFSWFLGNNDRGVTLYDYSSGGCFDGLNESGLNKNMGAESTLSWLISLHRMIQIRRDLMVK